MKISPETSAILKNFATINDGIYFTEGNIIKTISKQKNIYAEAKIDENIPKSFGIYNLINFLSVTSLFKDGLELDFDNHHVIIKGMNGRTKIKYRFTDKTMIVVPDKEYRIKPEMVDVKFNITQEDLNWVTKTANVLNSKDIAVESDGETVSLVTFDASDDSAHTNSLQLTDVDPEGKSFKLIFKADNLKLIPDNYFVEIMAKGFSSWTSTTQELRYTIAIETNSKF